MSGLMHDSQYSLKGLHEKAWEHAQKRLSRLRGTIEARRGELRDLKEAFSYRLLEQLAAGGAVDELLDEYLEDESRKRLEEELAMMDRMEETIEPEDIRDSLKEYVEKDLIEIDGRRGQDHSEGLRQACEIRTQADMGEPCRGPCRHTCHERGRLRHERRLCMQEA